MSSWLLSGESQQCSVSLHGNLEIPGEIPTVAKFCQR